MAEIEALDTVLRAIHNAVLEAQKLTEQQHQRQLRRYFREDGTPVIQTIRVPNISPDAKEKYRDIEVPVFALFPPSAIRIRDVTINLRVHLVGFPEGSESDEGFEVIATEKKGRHSGPLRVIIGKRDREEEVTVATIAISFGEVEPPEAVHRIVELLSASIP